MKINLIKRYHRSAILGSAIFLSILFSMTGCAAPKQLENTGSFSFALIGNTYPDSPFSKASTDMGKLIDTLNRENPTFVIHTGNLVFGGYTVGIREVDLMRQFNNLKATLSPLARVCYFIPGEMDSNMGSMKALESFTEKRAYYSFGYGSILFIVLNSTDGAIGHIGEEQWTWLEKTLLQTNGDSVIVLIHHPVTSQYGYDGPLLQNSQRFYKILSPYRLRAVISGAGENYYRMDIDDVAYINAGCVPIIKKESASQFRYYIVTFSGGFLSITGKKL
jgi:3',5'-cyclic AMP phosphodiesterase CpdA